MSSTTTFSNASSTTTAFSNPKLWIRNPGYDLGLVTGGALFTLLVAALAFSQPTWLPVFFWIWVVAFEGSHFWATWSRTYFDKKYRSENKSVLVGSLVFFLAPALALYFDGSNGVAYATLYGFFIFVWSLYHNARQHFGFMSIYSGKAEISPSLKSKMTLALYMAVCFAQAHFLLNFKIQGVFGLAAASEVSPTLNFLVDQLPKLLSGVAFIYWIKLAFEAKSEAGEKFFMPIFYIGICLLFYTSMFYFIAPNDQFVQNLNGAETLMLIAIMNSLFHNIQYHAIVYHYGKKRYEGNQKGFGWAAWINKSSLSYMGFALLLGLAFGAIVWNVGDWPSPLGQWTQPSMRSWAYVLFFGIIGHHFFLDQVIWRPSKSKELKSYLS
ncbi:MAG: hypothetical protein CL675_03315 [Bdellovibrionaceae bacterium]|nr:hypothetical protein [Pseudobdellovibrionaceae bacterium]